MRPSHLDLRTLRALVLANDLGGYGHAGARLGRTPSAISLQMKRLQDEIGTPLYRKSGRGTSLTEAGELVLRYARRLLALNDELLTTVRGAALTGSLRLGMAQDFAESLLPALLRRFARTYPQVLVELRIEGNTAMVDAVQRGDLDLALAVGHADRPGAERVGALALAWIAGAEFAPRLDQPLPLVALGPQCAFRRLAIARLDAAARPWRLAAVSPSVAGLWASVQGGLGITVRSRIGVPPGLRCDGELFGLPALPIVPITLHLREEPGEAVVRLRQFIVEMLGEVLRHAS